MTTLTAPEQACILDRYAQATCEAIHDEMETALEFAIETLTEACPDVKALTLADSDQGDDLCFEDLECATHTGQTCPARLLLNTDDFAKFGYHLYASHVLWFEDTYGLEIAHRHSAGRYTLDLATYRARHAEHCGLD